MELTLFQAVNYILTAILCFLFLRYLYIYYTDRIIRPVSWLQMVKLGVIPSRLIKLEKKYPDKARFFSWWLQIERIKQRNIPGMMAELGVYKGESAEVIHLMDPERDFHLFDTFTGFTAGDLASETGEAATYTPDHFADTSVEAVLLRINGNNHVKIHKGYFPDSAGRLTGSFAFVNIDCDLYKPTLAGLAFFYPRLSPGGVIFIHDYNYKWPGITKAVDEFLKTIPESPVFFPDKHGSVMIIRNK